jgi:DNA topoisomerase-1
MAKNLVIVESPAKTKTLGRFLGKNYSVMATVGHLLDLPKSKLGVDVDNDFEIKYDVIKGKEKVLTGLKKAAKNAKTIFLAPDPDREGEAIAWHVATTLEGATSAEIVRVSFNEITKSAVLGAIESPREVDMNLVNAQQARRVLDRIVGYTVSPFLWKTVARNLSAGRVQSVALRLVCEREAEVKAFKSEEYWQVLAALKTKSGEQLTAKLAKIDDKTVASPVDKGANKVVIGSEKEVKAYVNEIKKAPFAVSATKESKKTRKPYAPFVTSTLQQDAARVFGLSPKRTMALAQKLYEGIEIGKDGATGLITYMRTDSTRISNEAVKAVRGHIKKEFGADYLPAKPNVYSKKKSAQDAHEAIRPTNMAFPPASLKKLLTPQELKLYTLIWNRFIASQMTPAKYNTQTIEITAGRFLFRANSTELAFDGFLKVYTETKEPDENGADENGAAQLPPLKAKDKLKLGKLTPNQSFTKPPARFSEAMLIKTMEADGIGRPSTYASIISTLRDRKYAELTERKLHPTELGMTVNKILTENLPKIFNVSFTAEMEKELDLIEEGSDDWIKVLHSFYSPFIKTVNGLKGKQAAIKDSITEKTDIKCKECGQPMIIKWGRNGRFLSCSGYPDCKTTSPLPGEEFDSKTDQVCEKCNSPMVIKMGRFGKFMACSAYPKCRNTKPITLGIDCPKDDCKGQMVEKKTRGGRMFYGCSKYPKCDFASWDKPVAKPCPACKHPYVVQKVTKAKGEFLRCPECKNDIVETPAESEAVA